jgi:hypothetical protein
MQRKCGNALFTFAETEMRREAAQRGVEREPELRTTRAVSSLLKTEFTEYMEEYV